MSTTYSDILRSHCRPLEPIPTGQTPVLPRLEGIRAVLFDLYGTLFISASGEVGMSRESASEAAMLGALAAVGVAPLAPLGPAAQHLFDVIEASHAESQSAGIEYPEVDIVEVWRRV
jgi:putative hydrolase of the HAD superfamily